MAATVQGILTDALYMSGIVAREFEVPTDAQVQDGLKQLNAILSQKQTDLAKNPYYQKYPFTAVVGQEAYFIPNLTIIETITYLQNDNLRSGMQNCSRDYYFGSARIQNLQTLPSYYFVEQEVGGATLYMYPLPNAAYPFEIRAKFKLDSVTQFEDLTGKFDMNYRDYLMVSTARRLCIYNGLPIPQNLIDLLKETESDIKNLMAPTDYTSKLLSPFPRRRGGGGILNPALSQYWGWVSW